MTNSPDYAEILRLYRKFSPHKGAALWEVFICIAQELDKTIGNGTGNGRTIKPELTGSPCGTPLRAGISQSDRWEVGKNGWDASDEITREDI